MIRVAVAGPPGVLRSGLESLLREQPDLQLLGVFESVDETPNADVLVAVDTTPSDSEIPGASIVWITAASEPVHIRAPLRNGIRSILPANSNSGEILAAIHAAAAGLSAFRIADLEASLATASQRPSEPPQLSPRELEVLRLLADGYPNKEIAWRLGISEHTVKFHVTSILNRLGASTRAEAVAIGMRNGWILL